MTSSKKVRDTKVLTIAYPMIKSKTLWALLAVGITVVASEAIAQSSTGLLGEFRKKSLVGSWLETGVFLGDQAGRTGKSLVSYHDDGTLTDVDSGGVTLVPPSVSSDALGGWRQLDWHTYVYTVSELFSDLSGNLVGSLKVRGRYVLSASGDEYQGYSFYEVLDADQHPLVPPVTGFVLNKGVRLPVDPPPPFKP